MNTRTMLNGVVIAALTIGAASAVQADGNADVDAVMKALDAEIEKTKGKDGGNGGVCKKPVASNDNSVEIVPSDKRSANAGRRAVESSLNGDEWDEVDNTPKDLKVVSVTVLGKGETPEEARLAAFRAAVEKAVGIYVDAESIMKNSELLKDRVNTISNADIKEYETIKKGKLKSGLYAIQIKAKVEKKAIAPKFRDVFPNIIVIVEFSVHLEQHDGLGGEHLRVGRELESVVNTQRILVSFVQITPSESLLIDNLSLLGIEHHAIEAVARQTREHLVGLLETLVHHHLVQVNEKAVDIDDDIATTMPSTRAKQSRQDQ